MRCGMCDVGRPVEQVGPAELSHLISHIPYPSILKSTGNLVQNTVLLDCWNDGMRASATSAVEIFHNLGSERLDSILCRHYVHL